MTDSSLELSPTVIAELTAHGVPEKLHPLFPHGLGGLILLHGGASVVLAETLGSLASGVHGGVERMAVGVDVNATHLRPATAGYVTAVCTAVKLGRTVCVHTIEITDEAGRGVCSARITNMLIPRTAR